MENAPGETLEASESWTSSQWKLFHRVIRKCGHFAEFFVLGIFMILLMKAMLVRYAKSFAFLGCVLAASCDETIQLFVPGRAGMLADVILDSIGSMCSIIVCTTLMALLKKHKNVYDEISDKVHILIVKYCADVLLYRSFGIGQIRIFQKALYLFHRIVKRQKNNPVPKFSKSIVLFHIVITYLIAFFPKNQYNYNI